MLFDLSGHIAEIEIQDFPFEIEKHGLLSTAA